MKYIVALYLVFAAGMIHAQQSLITVKGEGQAEIVPDFVEITATVYSEDKSVALAKQRADAQGRAVIEAIKRFKIAERDLAFSGVAIRRKVEYDRNSNEKMVGFVVNRTLTVKLRKLTQYEVLIEALSRAGITEIRPPLTGVDDEHGLKIAALREATRNAKGKADEVAAGLGVRVGRPYEIGEERLPTRQPVNLRRAQSEEVTQMRAASPVAGYDPLLFVPENIRVHATVWVSFNIEP